MSKYSLNDDSTKFYNKIYRIFIIAFILILIIGLVSNPNNSSNYVLGMIGCAAFILLLFFFVMKHESNLKEKNDDDAEYFGSLLESGEYFNSMEWQFKYQQYTENSKPHHLSSGSLKTDLSLRYIKKVLRRDFYIPLLIFPLVGVTPGMLIQDYSLSDIPFGLMMLIFIATLALLEVAYFAILYQVSLRFIKNWLNDHPRYKNSIKEISDSYNTGDAYECSYFCVVIGSKYIHGFDGEKFHTVLRDNVVSCTWDIERLVIYSTGKYGERYVGDEYRFNIKFLCKDADRGCSFKVTLDQFQIKMIMDRYFPDISSDKNPSFKTTKIYGYKVSSIKKYASEPLI